MSYNYDLFISYCRRDDEEFVKRLYEDLTEKGLTVWWDRECMPSRALTFLQEIRDAIDHSRRLIAVVGPKAVESDYVLQEWIWASQFGNGIVPILRLGEYDLLPESFANLHCIDFRSDEHYSKALTELSRILAKPMKPLGILYKVPSLPPHFLYRKEDLDKMINIILADIREPTLSKSTPQPLVVHGMGGVGKSVLASALARTIDTRRTFTDGIFWLEFSNFKNEADLLNNLLENIATIGSVFNDDLRKYTDKNTALVQLTQDLHNKKVLIILDDVWGVTQVEPFLNVMNPHCRVLLTTREQTLIPAALEIQLDILNDNDAVQFLADWVQTDISSLPKTALDLIKECGNHTFAIALAGAMYQDGITWDDMYKALCEADLQYLEKRFPNYPHTDVFRMIKVSVDTFITHNPTRAKFYNELVVFRPEIIPENAIIVLWTRENELKAREARKLLITLNRKSLLKLEGRSPKSLVYLHDLHYDFLCSLVNDLTGLRRTLLKAYKQNCPEGWHTGPNDGYFFQHIGYLMTKLNCWEELVKLLTDLKYIETCSKYGVLYSLIRNYSDILASDGIPKKFRKKIQEFKQFVISQAHILRKYPQLTFQQAINQPDIFATSQAGKEINKIGEFSYSYLEWVNKPQFLDPCILTLEGHSKGVSGCAFSPDGTKIISSSWEELKLWDVKSGDEVRSFKEQSDWVSGCAFSPDGTKFLSFGGKVVKLWDIELGTIIRTFDGHTSPVSRCTFSPDGRKILSASTDRTLKLWETKSGDLIRTFEGHTAGVLGCAFSPNGTKILSASADGTLKIWNVSSGDVVRTFLGHSDEIKACAFSPFGDKVLSASRDKTIKLWDVKTGTEIRTFIGHSGWVFGCAFSPNGKKILSAAGNRELKLWDTEKGTEIKTFEGHSRWVWDCTFSPDGSKILSASYDKTLKLWNIEAISGVKMFKGHSSGIWKCVFSSDGTKILTASGDKTLKLWETESGNLIRTFIGHNKGISGCAFSPNGMEILSASGDRTLKLWDIKSGEVIKTFKGHSEGIWDCAISPDGTKILSASEDRTLKLWDAISGKVILTLVGHSSPVSRCTFSLDGTKILSASEDRTLKLWDARKGTEMKEFTGHSKGVWGCAFSPDGTGILSASYDKTLMLWDVETGEIIRSFKGHTGGVWGCAFSPDGARILSASFDGTLRIWNTKTGEEVWLFPALNSVYSVASNQDSHSHNLLITASDSDGRIYILKAHGYVFR